MSNPTRLAADDTRVLPRLIPAREVRRRCAGISPVTLYRWLRDPTLDFPQPIRINKRMFFAEDRIAEWLERRADA